MINNDDELEVISAEVSAKLQEINDYLGERNHPKGTIRFPRRYLRKCVSHRRRYRFIKDHVLTSNIAYTILQSDVFRWLLNRTDITGQAKEMLIKKNISCIGAIIESVTKAYLKGNTGGGQNYKLRTQTLVTQEIITAESKFELDWVWDVRNKEHLMLLNQREWNLYEMSDLNRAIRALHALRDQLQTHADQGGF